MEPADVSLETTDLGQRRLRFSNEIQNAHTGALEVRFTKLKCLNSENKAGRIARQRIYRDADGNGFFERGVDQGVLVRDAGCMTFHQEHRHWHFDDVAFYELFSLADGVRGALAAVSEKRTVCLRDNFNVLPALPGSPVDKYYTLCSRNATQGLSVGWSDRYAANLPDQYIVIDGLPDGRYCLVSTANPTGSLWESDTTNNSESVVVNVGTSSVTAEPATVC